MRLKTQEKNNLMRLKNPENNLNEIKSPGKK